jgi:hypothetical protein
MFKILGQQYQERREQVFQVFQIPHNGKSPQSERMLGPLGLLWKALGRRPCGKCWKSLKLAPCQTPKTKEAFKGGSCRNHLYGDLFIGLIRAWMLSTADRLFLFPPEDA